ncbi:copper homeostasis protein CutC [soil metagenome]
MTKVLLEACVANIESAVAAVAAGADRLELCNVLGAGGITPSFGFIEMVLKKISIPVHVLIRPREGDFLYSDDEFDIMKRDIEKCRESGVAGIVTGILKDNGSVDIERCKVLISAAKPLPVTFHRAFDLTSDAFTSLEEIIQMGCYRILTSGQRAGAMHGAGFISGLIKQANGRIIVMPGGGINDKNISQLRKTTGANEFHLSARMIKPSKMLYRNEFVMMSGEEADEYSHDVLNPEQFKKVREYANQ